MSNLDKPAMPQYGWSEIAEKHTVTGGMTVRQHAALTLRVPMSGDPELDAMIREARRLDMATAAMQGSRSHPDSDCWSSTNVAESALADADALLAACEPKKAEPERCPCCDSTGDVHSANGEWRGECTACQPQPDAEGWIEWHGVGDCPIYGATIVECKLRDGSTYRDLAGELRWDHYGSGGDIIAYRVVKD